MRQKIIEIFREIQSFSRSDRIFLLSVMICSICITSDYSIIKPTSTSIFISEYGSQFFPIVWLIILPVNFIIVLCYNRLVSKLSCFSVHLWILTLTLGLHIFCGLFAKQIHYLPFIQYIWKDIYVLLMFQQIWSLIHSKVAFSKAKYLYGLIFGMGGIGSMIGSIAPGFFAIKIGSQHLFFLSIPIYLLFTLFFMICLKHSSFHYGGTNTKHITSSADFLEGFKLIRKSSILKFILMIVLFMQFTASIMEYQFNLYLQTHYPVLDLRTEFIGRIFGAVHTINILIQFIGSFILIHFLGIRKSHIFIPLILMVNSISFFLFPIFSWAIISYATIKIFDYSLFGILKEMLYNPLDISEKFKAKSIIDVFVYRSSKALGSIAILCLQLFSYTLMQQILLWLPILIAAIWVLMAYFVLHPRYFEGHA